jgi:hypothetical protein
MVGVDDHEGRAGVADRSFDRAIPFGRKGFWLGRRVAIPGLWGWLG